MGELHVLFCSQFLICLGSPDLGLTTSGKEENKILCMFCLNFGSDDYSKNRFEFFWSVACLATSWRLVSRSSRWLKRFDDNIGNRNILNFFLSGKVG